MVVRQRERFRGSVGGQAAGEQQLSEGSARAALEAAVRGRSGATGGEWSGVG